MEISSPPCASYFAAESNIGTTQQPDAFTSAPQATSQITRLGLASNNVRKDTMPRASTALARVTALLITMPIIRLKSAKDSATIACSFSAITPPGDVWIDALNILTFLQTISPNSVAKAALEETMPILTAKNACQH